MDILSQIRIEREANNQLKKEMEIIESIPGLIQNKRISGEGGLLLSEIILANVIYLKNIIATARIWTN